MSGRLTWRLRITHDAPASELHVQALRRLGELKKKAGPLVSIKHSVVPVTGSELVDDVVVRWLGQVIRVVLTIHEGEALVALQAPAFMSRFEATLLARVISEVQATVKLAGGRAVPELTRTA